LFADLKTRPGMQELKASEVAAVCGGLAEQVSAGGIIHNSDPHAGDTGQRRGPIAQR
jgi:hypothetical protein